MVTFMQAFREIALSVIVDAVNAMVNGFLPRSGMITSSRGIHPTDRMPREFFVPRSVTTKIVHLHR